MSTEDADQARPSPVVSTTDYRGSGDYGSVIYLRSLVRRKDQAIARLEKQKTIKALQVDAALASCRTKEWLALVGEASFAVGLGFVAAGGPALFWAPLVLGFAFLVFARLLSPNIGGP